MNRFVTLALMSTVALSGASLCVSKIIDKKSAIPEQDRSGKQQNSPRRA
jgi:hypothetical protein